jgi:hypothetical protein
VGSTLFRVSNKHIAASGEPLYIDGDIPEQYHGYFQNEYGEQFVFVFDYQTNKGTLWSGDVGWDTSYEVVDGDVPELILDAHERLWLQACWKAAIARLQT